MDLAYAGSTLCRFMTQVNRSFYVPGAQRHCFGYVEVATNVRYEPVFAMIRDSFLYVCSTSANQPTLPSWTTELRERLKMHKARGSVEHSDSFIHGTIDGIDFHFSFK